MNCKNCGYPLFSNDKFCKNCGQEVVKEPDIKPVVEESKVNDGPIMPVISENNNAVPNNDNYDNIEGPKEINNVMSMPTINRNDPIPDFNAPKIEKKEEEVSSTDEGLSNVNQALPSIPSERKTTTSSVIIPTKPQPINNQSSEPVNNGMVNNPINNSNPYNNSYNGTYNNQFNNQFNQPIMEKKNNSFLKPIITLIVIALLGVGGYFGYKYLVDNGIIGNKETTNEVSYSGYKFDVSTKLKTQINSNSLVAYDDVALLSFNFVTGSYEDISTSLIVENFTSLGNTATYLGEKEYETHKYHLFQVKVEDKNGYVGYIASGTTKIICFAVEPKTGNELPSEDYLNKAVKIAISATYNGSSNIESNVVDEDSTVLEASKALMGEEEVAGDINEEDQYEEIYVNITLNEINE